MMVLHTNGWHRVVLRYCNCDMVHRAGDYLDQLLRFELYPATVGDPTTCATFRVLETFHALTLQGKITVYDFYTTMNNMTDNTGVDITWVGATDQSTICSAKLGICRTVSSSYYVWCASGATSRVSRELGGRTKVDRVAAPNLVSSRCSALLVPAQGSTYQMTGVMRRMRRGAFFALSDTLIIF